MGVLPKEMIDSIPVQIRIKQLIVLDIALQLIWPYSCLLLAAWFGPQSGPLLLIQAAKAKAVSVQTSTSQKTHNPKLTELELRLFFRDFSSDDEIARLNRIEMQIFGKTFTDSQAERIARIEAALPLIDKPEAKTVETVGAETKPYRAPKPDDPETADDAMDRDRLAVLSAKQKEISSLLSEGVSLWRAKQGVQAIEKFEQVVRLDPENVQALFSLGVAYESKGAIAQADQCYRKAVALDPNNKECSEALKAIQKKIALKQNISLHQSQLHELAADAAKAYQSGELLSALDRYKQLDDQQPNQALVKWNIGTIYLLLKNPYSALQYYREASKLKPDEKRYAQAVAQLEENIKQKEEQEKQAEAPYRQVETRTRTMPNSSSQPPPQAPPRTNSYHQNTQPDLLLFYGLSIKNNKQGARIIDITPGSRAAQVGLQVGDLVKAVDGVVVTTTSEINQILLSKPQGQRFQFSVQRQKHLGPILF